MVDAFAFDASDHFDASGSVFFKADEWADGVDAFTIPAVQADGLPDAAVSDVNSPVPTELGAWFAYLVESMMFSVWQEADFLLTRVGVAHRRCQRNGNLVFP